MTGEEEEVEPTGDRANPYGRLGATYLQAGQRGVEAPGRYCLPPRPPWSPHGTCYCGRCAWFVPLPPPGSQAHPVIVAPPVAAAGDESEWD